MFKSFFKRSTVPFFVLGGQVHNSSAYNTQELEPSWQALSLLKANVAEVPVYWEQIEPREDTFVFDAIDSIILAAREHNLNLILLWFATWKNGSMQYAPDWVKSNPERFQRVVTHAGNALWVLSSHSQENWDADNKAFCTLMAHLRQFDGQQKTVIGIQVENEPGILGAVRDHSALAEAEFNAAVPYDFTQALEQAGTGPIFAAWKNAGKLPRGPWTDLFGQDAAEYFTAWSIARYIDRLAESGKAFYELPMTVNVWLGENAWRLPGDSYPSGGPASVVLDIWKWAAPHIDCISPDIYIDTPDIYRAVCAAYNRPDNALFVPESAGSPGNALNIFEAIANYDAIGYAVFGVESLLAPDGTIKPQNKALVESFQCVSAIRPALEESWGSGRIHAVIQREFMGEQLIDLGEFLGMARFTGESNHFFTDHRHSQPSSESHQRGRGLVIQAAERTFYLVGTGFTLYLKHKSSEEAQFSRAHERYDGPLTHYLSVEEGHFNLFGEWVTDRVRNGDEITNGLWVSPDAGVVRALLTV
jgi:hypothetical protein